MGSQGFVHCIGTSYGKISFILLWYFSYFKTLISALNLMFDLCLFIAYLSPSLFAEFCRLHCHCTTAIFETSTAAAAELKTSSDAQTFVDLLLSKRAHLWNATSKVAPSRKCHKHTLASNQGRQMFSFDIFLRSVCIGQNGWPNLSFEDSLLKLFLFPKFLKLFSEQLQLFRATLSFSI